VPGYCVPLLNRAIKGRLVTLYIVDRKTGRPTVPSPHRDGDILIGTPFGWGHNLRTGAPVDILLQGRRRSAMCGYSRRARRRVLLR
jgi:hypothetical protein